MSDEVLKAYRDTVRELTAPGAAFALKQVMARGTPVQVFAGTPDSLNEIFETAVAQHGDADFLEYEGARRTFTEVFVEATSLGGALRERCGVQPGDRVGIMMRNRPEWFTVFMAVARIGAVATLLNSRGAGDEVAAAADKVGCRLIVADPRSQERLAQGAVAARVIGFPELAELCAAGGADRSAANVDPDDPAVIMFTSGTTGRAKGATLTHRNLAATTANIRFSQRVGQTLAARRMGVPVEALIKGSPPPSVLMLMPLFHISGVVNFFMSLLSGGLMTLIPRWDVGEAVRLIEKNKVTAFAGPSMVIGDLLDYPGAVERIQTLSSVVVGGQATPIALGERVLKLLPRASQATGWGMTELTGQAAGATGAMFFAFPGTCGLFNPLSEARVADPEGRSLPPGQPGELQVRGVLVSPGYYNEPEATAAAFMDGWFRSGDIGVIDERGIVSIVDRAKDMVISAGENIYCAEVERVLGTHPDVAEAAMFGVPDERLGERAIAAVMLRPDAEMDAAAVQAIAAARLADYKVPKEVRFDLAPFPRNAVGKVDKSALRRRYLATQHVQA